MFLLGSDYQGIDRGYESIDTDNSTYEYFICEANKQLTYSDSHNHKTNKIEGETYNQSSPMYLTWAVVGGSFRCLGRCESPAILCCEVRIIRNPDFEEQN